jgi:hypothetical protein
MDWLITILSIVSKGMLAEEIRIGWVISFFSQFLWIKVCLDKDLPGLVLLSVVNIVLCVRGYHRWSR